MEELTALEASRLIAAGQLTSETLVRSCLERVEELESGVQAWEHLDVDHAIAQARFADRATIRGPLHGVPLAIKDVIDTVDRPTARASIEDINPQWMRPVSHSPGPPARSFMVRRSRRNSRRGLRASHAIRTIRRTRPEDRPAALLPPSRAGWCPGRSERKHTGPRSGPPPSAVWWTFLHNRSPSTITRQ